MAYSCECLYQRLVRDQHNTTQQTRERERETRERQERDQREIRERLERDQREIRERLERDQRETRETRERLERNQKDKRDGAMADGLTQTNKIVRERARGVARESQIKLERALERR